ATGSDLGDSVGVGSATGVSAGVGSTRGVSSGGVACGTDFGSSLVTRRLRCEFLVLTRTGCGVSTATSELFDATGAASRSATLNSNLEAAPVASNSSEVAVDTPQPVRV